MRLSNTIIAATLLLLASTSIAMALPKGMAATYAVFRGNMSVGVLESRLSYGNDNTYQYHKATRAQGLAKLLTGMRIRETSDGRVAGDRLLPVAYMYDEKSRSKTRVDNVRFNGSQISGRYRDQPYAFKIPANTLDRSSMEVAVARDLQLGRQTLSYNIVERGKLKNYTLIQQGAEQLSTPAGVFNTVRLLVQRSDSDRQTVLWMAAELDYMPAKIQHIEKDTVMTAVINSYRY